MFPTLDSHYKIKGGDPMPKYRTTLLRELGATYQLYERLLAPEDGLFFEWDDEARDIDWYLNEGLPEALKDNAAIIALRDDSESDEKTAAAKRELAPIVAPLLAAAPPMQNPRRQFIERLDRFMHEHGGTGTWPNYQIRRGRKRRSFKVALHAIPMLCEEDAYHFCADVRIDWRAGGENSILNSRDNQHLMIPDDRNELEGSQLHDCMRYVIRQLYADGMVRLNKQELNLYKISPRWLSQTVGIVIYLGFAALIGYLIGAFSDSALRLLNSDITFPREWMWAVTTGIAAIYLAMAKLFDW